MWCIHPALQLLEHHHQCCSLKGLLRLMSFKPMQKVDTYCEFLYLYYVVLWSKTNIDANNDAVYERIYSKHQWKNFRVRLKNTGALFVNQFAAPLTAIFYHAVLVYVLELYAQCALLSLEWQTCMVSLSSLVHINILLTGCCSAIAEKQRWGLWSQ